MDLTPLLDLKALTKYPVDSGGSCDIYRGRLHDGPIIALKTTRVSQTPNNDSNLDSQNMQRIIGIWKECKHPNVVHLIGETSLRGSLAAVYGWVEYGGVVEYLKRHPEADRYRICTQICEGLVHLHMSGIIHNSLKGTNILVSGSGVPQIHLSLLTSTSWANDGIDNKVPKPSIRWAAPELLLAESGGTFASDVYALGMTILETMTVAIPYPDMRDSQVLMKVMNQGLPARPRDHIPDTPAGNALWNLMCTCWSFDPANRPSAAHVRDVIYTIYTGSSRSFAPHDPMFNIAMEPPRLVVTEDTQIQDLITYFVKRGLKDYTDDLKLTNIAITTPFADTALANVYKLSLPSQQTIAVKCVKHVTPYKKLKRAARELSFWSSYKHENILPVLGFGVVRGDLAMVSPWMSNGCVTEYVTRNPSCDRLRLCTELTRAIVYLHGHDLVHGDIKGANVLVCGTGIVKVTDFGVSIMEHKEVEFSATSTARGTQRWQSPEILLGDSDSTKEGDVYALGMTLVEIYTGESPYGSMNWTGNVMIKVISGQLRPSRPIALPPNNYGNKLWELMNQCWATRPNERPTSEQVYERLKEI